MFNIISSTFIAILYNHEQKHMKNVLKLLKVNNKKHNSFLSEITIGTLFATFEQAQNVGLVLFLLTLSKFNRLVYYHN